MILSGNRIANRSGGANDGGDGGDDDVRVEEARISSALGAGVGMAVGIGFEGWAVRTGVEEGSMVVEAWRVVFLAEGMVEVAGEDSLEEDTAVRSLRRPDSLVLRGRSARALGIAGAAGWS